jgi:hypothetical protein
MYRKSLTEQIYRRKRERAAKARAVRMATDSEPRHDAAEKIGTLIGIGFGGSPFCVSVYSVSRRIVLRGDAHSVRLAGVPLWTVVKAARKADATP